MLRRGRGGERRGTDIANSSEVGNPDRKFHLSRFRGSAKNVTPPSGNFSYL
jgi:hypothetical protein